MMRISSAVLTTKKRSWGRRNPTELEHSTRSAPTGPANTIYDFEKMFLPDDCLAKMREVAANARGPGWATEHLPQRADDRGFDRLPDGRRP